MAEYAASVGGDMIQVLMPLRPWGGEPASEELVAYFDEIASNSHLPVVAYHNPGPGADPSVASLIKLSQIPGIQCFKESSRDITKITRLIEEIELSGTAHYFTTMQPLLITLLMGGSGGTMPPPGTRIGANVVRAFRAGDLERAKYWQRLYSLFPGKWASYGLPPVMKASMRHFGIDIGTPARPYRPVTEAEDAQIGRFFQETGLLESNEPPMVSFDRVLASVK